MGQSLGGLERTTDGVHSPSSDLRSARNAVSAFRGHDRPRLHTASPVPLGARGRRGRGSFCRRRMAATAGRRPLGSSRRCLHVRSCGLRRRSSTASWLRASGAVSRRHIPRGHRSRPRSRGARRRSLEWTLGATAAGRLGRRRRDGGDLRRVPMARAAIRPSAFRHQQHARLQRGHERRLPGPGHLRLGARPWNVRRTALPRQVSRHDAAARLGDRAYRAWPSALGLDHRMCRGRSRAAIDVIRLVLGAGRCRLDRGRRGFGRRARPPDFGCRHRRGARHARSRDARYRDRSGYSRRRHRPRLGCTFVHDRISNADVGSGSQDLVAATNRGVWTRPSLSPTRASQS